MVLIILSSLILQILLWNYILKLNRVIFTIWCVWTSAFCPEIAELANLWFGINCILLVKYQTISYQFTINYSAIQYAAGVWYTQVALSMWLKDLYFMQERKYLMCLEIMQRHNVLYLLLFVMNENKECFISSFMGSHHLIIEYIKSSHCIRWN